MVDLRRTLSGAFSIDSSIKIGNAKKKLADNLKIQRDNLQRQFRARQAQAQANELAELDQQLQNINQQLIILDLHQLNQLYLDHYVSLHGHNRTLYEGFLLLLILFHKFSNKVLWHA